MEFKGVYSFLSNMHKCFLSMEGIMFTSAEQAYVYFKCINESDKEKVLSTDNPYEVKQIGKTVQLRADWDEVKVSIMSEILLAKFLQNNDLTKKLIKVTEPIVEENWWGDTFWGVCNGHGENTLGILLTTIRTAILNNIRSKPYVETYPEKVQIIEHEIILQDPSHYNLYLNGKAYAY